MEDYIPKHCEQCYKAKNSTELKFILDANINFCGYYVCDMCYLELAREYTYKYR